MKVLHIDQTELLARANVGEPFVAYSVDDNSGETVFEQGGIITETLDVQEPTRLIIGKTAIEALLENRWEQYEATSDPEWAVDALTIIALFPEATDQDFSLARPTNAVIEDVTTSTVTELLNERSTDTAIRRLEQLDASPNYLRRAIYREIGSRGIGLSADNTFFRAYTHYYQTLQALDIFSVTAMLERDLSDSAE